jgi:hypothetical protein
MRASISVAAMAACVLSGCGQAESGSVAGGKDRGRYSGIGTYTAGNLWARMVGIQPASDTAAARLEDDDQIIVVIDSQTGEVRQCGNHSGVCVTMNPWTGPGPSLAAPVKLSVHASDLEEEEQAAAGVSPTRSNAAPQRP